jgi:hypothetical protein
LGGREGCEKRQAQGEKGRACEHGRGSRSKPIAVHSVQDYPIGCRSSIRGVRISK